MKSKVKSIENKYFRFKISDGDPEVAYLSLPGHPRAVVPGIVKKQLSLSDLIEGYVGPSVYLDFNEEGRLIGLEFLT